MTSAKYPWAKINRPTSGFNVLLVDPKNPHDFHWGKDSEGNYLLVLEIKDGYETLLEKKKIDFKGIQTDLRINNTGKYTFVLSLRLLENGDIFMQLCNDLIESTARFTDNRSALDAIYSRLHTWRTFLSRDRHNLLTDSERQGLFAELVFLGECIERRKYSLGAVLNGWQGPLGGPHDFVLGKTAIEIKSISGSSKKNVRISSENQLVTNHDRLYLHIIFLAQYHDGSTGTSLNQMASRIKRLFDDIDLLDLYESRLCSAGFIDLRDYDAPTFSVIKQCSYEVKEGFPRIKPDMLPPGISNVSYDLDLLSVEKYGVNSFVL